MRPWLTDTNISESRRLLIDHLRGEVIPATLKKLAIIEKERPGIAAALQKRFGINNFSWYPVQMLIRQYDEMDIPEKPYGVVWTPSIDLKNWVPSNMPAIEELYLKIGDKYGIRFFEADEKLGQQGVVRRFIDFHRNYYLKGGPKIQFMVIMGHTAESFDRMHFGSGFGDEHNLLLEDLQAPKTTLLRDVFVPKPDVIWAACWSNQKLAPALEKALDARVIGSPYKVNSIEHFEVSEGSGQLHLDTIFPERE